MDITQRCVLCEGTGRFFCKYQQQIILLCARCVKVHLAELQNRVHQVQALPGADSYTGSINATQFDVRKFLSSGFDIRLFESYNPGNSLTEGAVCEEMDQRKPFHLGKVLRSAGDIERLARGIPVDNLFMHSHVHSQRQPKKPKGNLFIFQPDSRNTCFYDPHEDAIFWRQTPRDFPSGAGICVLSSGSIMCAGGYAEARWLADAFVWDHASGKVTELPGMTAARECHGCVQMRDYIYVFGGVNESGVMSQCERYAQSSRIWQGLPSLEKPMSKLTPIVINSRIYIAGYGHTAVLEFNPTTLKFKSLFAGLLSPSEAVSAFTCGEHLFLLQGAFLVCADVNAGSSSQPTKREADHRHWYSPTPLLHIGGCVYFCRWHDEVWEFGLEHCTMRHLLSLDFTQFD
jgi:hypothetical protein